VKHGIGLVLGFVVLVSGAAFAAEAGAPKRKGDVLGRKDVRYLSLREAIAMAAENNLDIAVQEYGPRLSATDIVVQKAVFDPVFTASASVEDRNTPTENVLAGAGGRRALVSDIWKFDTKLEQKMVTGASIYAEYSMVRTNTTNIFSRLNPKFESDLTLNIQQPLLRGAGVGYNRSQIRIANLNKKISEYQLKTEMMNVAADVQHKYWLLVQRIRELEIARKSLKRAQDLLANNIARCDAGIIPPIQVTEAEAEVATQQENIVNAENALRNAESDLKEVMNVPELSVLSEIAIVPVDEPISEAKEIDWVYCVEKALQLRPDFLEAKTRLENNKIEIKVRKNELYPQIDLIGSFNLNGLGSNWGNDNDMVFSANFYDAFLGFEVSIPLGGNREAKARYTRAQLEAAQQLRALKRLELQIITDVREAVRDVDTNLERIDATRKARQLQELRLDAAEKTLAVGRATTFEVLEAQEDLAVAEGRELSAKIDYNRSLVTLSQQMGTILDELDIVVEEASASN